MYRRLVCLLLSTVVLSAQHHGNEGGAAKPAQLLPGLGSTAHRITTTSPEAQRFFNQGLSLVYAFNHEEAARAFQRAAELDEKCAMCLWGIALSVGPNINDPEFDPGRVKIAVAALAKARALNASDHERAYINALSRRYSLDPKAVPRGLAVAYSEAMRQLMRRYPDDLDAATLFAESRMNLRPWALYALDGKPAEGTEEIVTVLESVLKRDPGHVGANHYYVHAVEASNRPERALASAKALPRLTPGAGHLVHMPAHVYMRTGDYRAASEANRQAARTDEEYMEKSVPGPMYAGMYYPHNLHFLAVSAAVEGRSAESIAAADKTTQKTAPLALHMPMAEYFVPTKTLILVKLRRWDDVLSLAEPDAALIASRALWRFARAMAYAHTGRAVLALGERNAFDKLAASVPQGAMLNLNTAASLLSIARHMLDASLARASGDLSSAANHLGKAIALEDTLNYDEPPAWYLFARETLGGVLMAASRYPDAERIFRQDLKAHPRNPRSLFGLAEALKRQGRAAEGEQVWKEFQKGWSGADMKLSLDDL